MSGERVSLPAPELVLVRYGELALKGGNRLDFEKALVRNLKAALEPIAPVRVERLRGRVWITPAGRVEEIAERAADVFGVKSVSPAWSVAPDLEAIAELGRAVFLDALARLPAGREHTMRVASKRADKRFPLTSVELDRFLGERVLSGIEGVRVDLDRPEIVLGVELRPEGSCVFARRIAGPGGLPVGTQGRGLCLLSGGIDSPVAAWMTLKRGLALSYVSFHSYPFLGEASKEKVVALVRALARFQPHGRLYVLPFTEIQLAIRDSAPEAYRTILYRRMMQRLASRLCDAHGHEVLVTGESLGQVASQTVANLRCIELAATHLVLRPLIGFDKDETIAIARRIGTFDISNIPEPDCCTVFQPAKPVIHGDPADCERAEARLDVGGLIERALAGLEVVAFGSRASVPGA